MNIIEAESLLAQNPISIPDVSFELISCIAEEYNKDTESPDVQRLVLRALQNREHLNGEAIYLNSIARQLGLFPYLVYEQLNIRDQIAFQYHSIEKLDVVFHSPQARVFREILEGNNVVLSAPTSFGKSLIIDAVLSEGKYTNVLLVVPTIALMDETRRRLAKLPIDHKVITSGLQQPSEKNVYVLTQERALEQKERLESIDLLIIDEFYKLDTDREEDGSRAELLNQVFYRYAKKGVQYYLLGPNIRAVTSDLSKRSEYTFFQEPYHTVVSVEQDVNVAPDQDEFDALEELCVRIGGPTIVYCASVPRCLRAANAIAANTIVGEEAMARISNATSWIAEHYHPEWGFITSMKAGVGVHHGRIPRSLAQLVVRYFDEELLDFLVCTSSMIEGVNTKAENIVILDKKVSRTDFDLFTFNNIRGRAGRMFKHFVGQVYMFHAAPQQELPFIDIPAFSQSDNASDSLLLQLDDDDLAEESRSKIDWIYDQHVLMPSTIKANAGIDPHDQIAFAEELRSDIPAAVAMCSWTSRPTWDQLTKLCFHMWNTFGGKRSRSGVYSHKQLARNIMALSQRPSIAEMIQEQLDYFKDDKIDAHIDDVLSFLRNWAGFNFPRLLRTMDLIQKEVLDEADAGNFLSYAAQVECWFRDPVISALDEYGLPMQIVDEIQNIVLVEGDFDATVDKIRELDVQSLNLHPFSLEIIEDFQNSFR